MEYSGIVQKKFIQEFRLRLPHNLSLANVIADELNISVDSAYRRIRGESDLSLEEFAHLSKKYGINTSAFINNEEGTVAFNYRSINEKTFSFNEYFQSLSDEMQSLEQNGLKEVIYVALDLPVFYYFLSPKLAAFKIFFWRRNVFNYSDTIETKFRFDDIPALEMEKSQLMLQSYLNIPTTEIWTEETLNSTLRQIWFYHEIGLFEKKEDILEILDDVRRVLDHVQKQSEYGFKIHPDNYESPKGEAGNFKLYHNEVTLAENVILLRLEKFNVVHIGHNVLNILSTTNESFFLDTMQYIEKVIKNSSQISISSEKERKRFFNLLYEKIDQIARKI